MEIVTVTVNFCCIYLLVNARAYCVFISSKVFLELHSYLKSVSHIINIPRLLGLYRVNIGPGFGSRD